MDYCTHLGSHYVNCSTHIISKASAQLDSFMRWLGMVVPIFYRKYMPIKQKQQKQDVRTHKPALQ